MVTWLAVRTYGFQTANQIVHFSNFKEQFTRRFLNTRCQITWRILCGTLQVSEKYLVSYYVFKPSYLRRKRSIKKHSDVLQYAVDLEGFSLYQTSNAICKLSILTLKYFSIFLVWVIAHRFDFIFHNKYTLYIILYISSTRDILVNKIYSSISSQLLAETSITKHLYDCMKSA